MNVFHTRQGSIVGAVALGTMIAFAPSDGYAIDFSDKKIQILVASKEGGSTDRYARIFQPFLKKYLPGNPTVLVRIMPGGGGLAIKASNWFEKRAKPDGTNLMTSGGSVLTGHLFGGKKTKYNVTNWNPVVMSPFGTCFYAHKKTGLSGTDILSDIKKLRATDGLMMGAKNPTGSELRAFISYDILGLTNIRPIFGMSTGKRRKAVIRGELQLGMDSALKCLGIGKKYVKMGTLSIYMTLGFLDENFDLVRDPALPDKPHVAEIYEKLHGKKLTGMKLNVLKLFVNLSAMANKTLWLPKNTPKKTIDFYVATVKKIYKDKEFQKRTKKSFGNYPQSFGERAKKILQGAVDIDPETRKWMNKWIDSRMRSAT